MKNLFIPYKLALIAKQKGYPQATGSNLGAWELKDGVEWFYTGAHPVGLLAAPLYQQIIDWFRDKHNIHFNFKTIENFKTINQTIKQPLWYQIWLEKQGVFTQNINIGSGEYYTILKKAIQEAFKLI